MKKTSAEIVEQYLRDQHANNLRQKIWPSNNVVIDRLLKDSANLCSAWDELLKAHPCGNPATGSFCEKWQMVLDRIVDVAAGWSPEEVSITRQAIRDVSVLTTEIQDKAHELAELLRQRSRICEMNAISKTPMDVHPIDLLGPAARIADRHTLPYGHTYSRFTGFVAEPLSKLAYQFDLKYWPQTADLVDAIAEAQDDADFSVDRLSESALAVDQASTRDFMRPLDEAFSDLARFDIEISFSHASYAAIINAACGLDQAVSAQSVKAYRSYERKRTG